MIDVETGRLLRTAIEDCECLIEAVLTQSVRNVAYKLADKTPPAEPKKLNMAKR